MATPLLATGPDSPAPTLVLAHGAGAAMDSEWMERIAELLGERGIRVVRFEFAYMAARRDGARRPPPKAETLMGEYREVVERVAAESREAGWGGRIAIGGKSMGGRVASLIADSARADGLVGGAVCLGYPFHPPGKPEQLRTAHLERLETPTLICQGTRDPFGTRDEVPGYALSPAIDLAWLEDGEHGFVPRVKLSGFTHAEHLATAADAVAAHVIRTTA